MIFKRKIYNELLQWKRTDEGRTAVLIQGARRVGKSTIAEEFATNEYETHILVDFAACSTEIRDLFNDVSDLNRIFMRLQLEYGVELKERKSVIIFDEVQLAPKARQAIKYLVKDGRYDYIETGSLISIRKNVKDILIPSEEVKLHMFPMDYEEFRWALGDTTTIRLLQGCFHDKTSLGDATNRKLMRDFRLYMLVGGMPQAVVVYLETNNLEKVDSVKRSIITLYEDDFNKIDPTGNASKIFRQIPAQLTAMPTGIWHGAQRMARVIPHWQRYFPKSGNRWWSTWLTMPMTRVWEWHCTKTPTNTRCLQAIRGCSSLSHSGTASLPTTQYTISCLLTS